MNAMSECGKITHTPGIVPTTREKSGGHGREGAFALHQTAVAGPLRHLFVETCHEPRRR